MLFTSIFAGVQSILSKLEELTSCVLHCVTGNSAYLQPCHFPRDAPMLVGFVVPACRKSVVWEESIGWGYGHLLRKLRRALPSSWIPDRLVLVDQLPLTPHGRDVYMDWHIEGQGGWMNSGLIKKIIKKKFKWRMGGLIVASRPDILQFTLFAALLYPHHTYMKYGKVSSICMSY